MAEKLENCDHRWKTIIAKKEIGKVSCICRKCRKIKKLTIEEFEKHERKTH
jgi:hypothetical protein